MHTINQTRLLIAPSSLRRWRQGEHSALGVACAALVAVLAGCTSAPVPEPTPPGKPASTPAARVEPVVRAVPSAPAEVPRVAASYATDARAYRRDAAAHLYRQNANRIFPGKMPPLLYAIGVLQVELDAQGRVNGIHWLRPPRHAPEVIAEIERTIRLAAPFPAPLRMRHVTYTETWLWHSSGRFQLDTLTEGQL